MSELTKAILADYNMTPRNRLSSPVQEMTSIEDIEAGLIAIWERPLMHEGFGRIAQADLNGASSVDDEIESMLYFRRHTAWYDTSAEDIKARRAFICDHAAPYFSRETLQASIIPTDSFVRPAIEQSCMLYKDPATRWLVNEAQNESYQALLRGAQIDALAMDWHARLRLCNILAVRPVVRERFGVKRLEYDSYTPDKFRALWDEEGNLEKLLVYAGTRIVNGVSTHVIAVWTNAAHYLLDCTGRRISVNDQDKNPYGRIPFTLMRLDLTSDWYSGSAYDLIRACQHVNYYEILTDADSTYAALNLLLATNTNIPATGAGPRDVLSVEGLRVGEGQLAPPSLEFVAGTPHGVQLRELAEKKETEIKLRESLSPAMLTTQARELSGAALQQLYRPLLEKRAADAAAMRVNETQLYELTAIVLRVEGLAKYDLSPESFNIDFAEIELAPQEADKRREEIDWRLSRGLLSYADVYRMYETDLDSDEEIIARIEANKRVNAMFEKRTPDFVAKLLGTKPAGANEDITV